MADPVTIAAIAAGAAAASSAVGAIYEGNAKAGAAEYNATVADQNAKLSSQQGAENERRTRVMGRKVLGSIRAGYGASGVTMEGSATDVYEESAATAELDALTARHSGEVKAYEYENEAKLERFRAQTSRVSGYLGGASSLISGAGKIAGGK